MDLPSVDKGRLVFSTQPAPYFVPSACRRVRYACAAAPHPARALKSENSEDLEGTDLWPVQGRGAQD